MLRVIKDCLVTIWCDSIQPKWLRPIYSLVQNSGMVVMCRNRFFYTATWCRGPHTRINVLSEVFQTDRHFRFVRVYGTCCWNHYVITRPRTHETCNGRRSRQSRTTISNLGKYIFPIELIAQYQLPEHTLLIYCYLVQRLSELNKQTFKVIPLKLFYYQTFFETWRNEHSWYEH